MKKLKKQTPEELLESGYESIRSSLEEEILLKLKSVHPPSFEKIVVQLLVKMGYGGSIQDAGKAIGKSGDEGIDGIIKEDKLGLDVIYIQAKDGKVLLEGRNCTNLWEHWQDRGPRKVYLLQHQGSLKKRNYIHQKMKQK